MSYDLTFHVENSKSVPTIDEVVEFLAPRLYYRAEGNELWYENQDTGVYFSLGFGAPPPEELEVTETIRNAGYQWLGITFNMNYFRPGVFALEAAEELDALVNKFHLVVDDPQIDGMGLGPFSKQAFIRGWNAGNSLAISAMKTQQGEGIVNRLQLLPTAEINRIWTWNFDRRRLQSQLGPEIFVARITPLLVDGQFATMAVWSDGIPSVLPVVDYLGLYRQDLAPKRFLRKAKPDIQFLKLADVESALGLPKPEKREGFATSAYVLESTGAREADFFRQIKSGAPNCTGLAFDSIIDREVFESAKVLKVAYQSDPS